MISGTKHPNIFPNHKPYHRFLHFLRFSFWILRPIILVLRSKKFRSIQRLHVRSLFPSSILQGRFSNGLKTRNIRTVKFSNILTNCVAQKMQIFITFKKAYYNFYYVFIIALSEIEMNFINFHKLFFQQFYLPTIRR